MQPLVLKTERADVLLREYCVEDARDIFRVIDQSREHLSQWGDVTSSKYPDLASVIQSIRHPIAPSRLRMGIWLNNQFAGSINMQPLPTPYHAEVGYWLGERFTGQRIMSTALRTMATHGFNVVEYYYLTANTRIENKASQHVLEHAGFRRIFQGSALYNSYYNYRLGAHEWSS